MIASDGARFLWYACIVEATIGIGVTIAIMLALGGVVGLPISLATMGAGLFLVAGSPAEVMVEGPVARVAPAIPPPVVVPSVPPTPKAPAPSTPPSPAP